MMAARPSGWLFAHVVVQQRLLTPSPATNDNPSPATGKNH
jgi:hypothetical protein